LRWYRLRTFGLFKCQALALSERIKLIRLLSFDAQRKPRRLSATSRLSHDLPNSIFREDLASKFPAKSLILLVGAAGFEPATWSTQNSRATRLRYTPPGSDEHQSTRTPRKRTLRKPIHASRRSGNVRSRRPCPEPKCDAVSSSSPGSRVLARDIGCAESQWRRIGVATRSPGWMPSLRAVPPTTSSTARTGPPEGMIFSDSVSVFSAMRRMRPSLWMKIMSSDT
jgi:hypothetical protein